jgi:hypothetical protein
MKKYSYRVTIQEEQTFDNADEARSFVMKVVGAGVVLISVTPATEEVAD